MAGEAKYEPGPWKAHIFSVTGPKGQDIALCWDSEDGNGKQTEANARLIAAAPELLEALQAIELHCSGKGDAKGAEHTAEGLRLREQIRAAITKATA
jgi:hypothetical protein